MVEAWIINSGERKVMGVMGKGGGWWWSLDDGELLLDPMEDEDFAKVGGVGVM